MDGFLSNESRRSWVIRIHYLGLFVAVLALISEIMQYRLVERIIAEGFTPELDQLAASNDMRQDWVAIIEILMIIIMVIFYLLWYVRAYNNLRALNIDLEYKSWWLIGGWLIPIASLFVPYKIMRERHDKTAQILRSHGIDANPKIFFCNLWWASWLILHFVSQIYIRFARTAFYLEELQTSSIIFIIAVIIELFAIFFSLGVIKAYGKMETDLYDLVQSGQISCKDADPPQDSAESAYE